MKWSKLGCIFSPSGNYPWMNSHASNPVADFIQDDIYRIYFTTRNSNNQGHIASVDVDLKNPTKILAISTKPVLSSGEIGTFDDSGVTSGCILNYKSEKYLFYLGWNLGITVPFRNAIGLAVYDKQQNVFIRNSKAPLIDRNKFDIFSLSYPNVLTENGVLKMWYGTHLKTGKNESDMQHVIRYVESSDIFEWKPKGDIAINLKNNDEYALSRPSVIFDDSIYKMWYSYRGASYRIGYAESKDGKIWTRKDEMVGIDVSESGWDAEMICYPHVFKHKEKYYMLYNGNGYGKTGLGLAILE